MNFETSLANRQGDIDYLAEDRPPVGRRRLMIIVALVVAGLALAIMLFAGKSKAPVAGAAKEGEKQAASVSVVTPGQTLVQNIVSATGTLAARQDMPIGAVGEGGMVTRVLVQPGTWVRAGQVLAIVDRQVQAQQTVQLSAQIRASEADARLAQNELERAKALAARGFVSKADIDRKTAQRDAAYARVGVARAQLAEAGARIRRLDIRAPASGLVLTRSVEPGQVVGPGSGALFRIAKDGAFELKTAVSEGDLVRMTVGLPADVTPVGATVPFKASIWQVSPVIDPQSRQGEVRLALPYDRSIRPGGFASARITSGTMMAPLLPESAVLSDPKGNFVYLVGGDGKVARRDVKIGTVTDNGVSIVEGLNGSERVVLSAGGFLNPGETVKAVPVKAR